MYRRSDLGNYLGSCGNELAVQYHAGSLPNGTFCCKVKLDVSVKIMQRQGEGGLHRSFALGIG